MNFISIHPYLIKREIQSMIQKRLSSLSKTEERYLEKKKSYENALNNSGFKTPLSYVQDYFKQKQRLRKNKVFYHNPPFSNFVKTNIGK